MLPFKRHWMRHTAAVPKGFIRYQVLDALSRKPMSGSEIMDEIEKRTDGHWRPSPGSIYPLLAWLQDNRYVKELPTDESGMKRYELTENGKTFLKEQRKIKMEFGKEPRLFGPPFMGPFWFHVPPEKTFEARESMRKLMTAFFELGGSLEKKFSEQALGEVKKVLDETTEGIEEINRKLKAKKYD